MRTLFAVAGNLIALAAGFGLLARYVSPQIFWPPAIIALLLPGLLLFLVVFIIIQLLRRRWRSVLLPAIVLAVAFPILGRLFAWPSSGIPIPDDGGTVTLVTGNQRMFRNAEGKDIDDETVRAFFDGLGADVLMLQEVWPERRKRSYIDAIREGSGLRERHQRDNTMVATYANTITETIDLYDGSQYHIILLTDVRTELGTIRVINTHMQSNKISGMAAGIRGEESVKEQVTTFGQMLAGYGRTTRRRAAQAEKVRRLVEESPYPVVLGGDFNDVPSSYAYYVALSPRLKDAWAERGSGLGTTFTGPLPGLRIDYFMVDTSLQVESIERINSPWSDHRALRVKLTK